jgi:hypothetical protein
VSGPFDSFLVLRGLKTLALRMERHCASAHDLARWLAAQPEVAQVHYPGLPVHPQHELAKRQMRGIVPFLIERGASTPWVTLRSIPNGLSTRAPLDGGANAQACGHASPRYLLLLLVRAGSPAAAA